jgi:cell division protein ZapA
MQSTEVEIFGRTYVIKGDADPEYVKFLASYVDEKVRGVAEKTPEGAGIHKLIALAAINIADELHKSRLHQQEIEKIVRDKTGDLFALLGAKEHG